uniref:Proteasomal ubiquitin receptor ADRM1 homolog n=1 Tax=Steinernema glaseri TaxID=37863 RepID=A0A1I8A5N3_9BILA
MALFANASRGGVSSTNHMVEFKAGRSTLEPGSTPEKRKVVSDKTKGLVYIKQSSDQLIHFVWKNRETNTVVDDLIIFPGDTEFLKVNECTDGRVFMLKFSSNNDRRLFWMQDNRAEKDDELVKKVNDVLNRPPTSRASGRGGTTERTGGIPASISSIANGSEEMGALNNLEPNQLMQLLQLMNTSGSSSSADALISSALSGSSSANALISSAVDSVVRLNSSTSTSDATATTTTTSADTATPTGTASTSSRRPTSGATAGAVKISDLQAILNVIDSKAKEAEKPGPQASLSEVLKSTNISETVKANEERLLPHLPQEPPVKADAEELNKTITTPQFQQAAAVFGNALQTGQMGPVLQHFGCGENVSAAAATGDLLKFAKNLTEEEKGGAERKEETTVDVEMSVAQMNAQIKREADAEETTDSVIREPSAKRNKTNDDDMDVD